MPQPPTAPPEPIQSNAAIGGHPLHPMLIHFPVAALVALPAADAAFLWNGDPFWARAGLWLAGVGALGGWVASLAGLVDLLTVQAIRRKVTAWTHALLAVMLLSLGTLNWLLRLRLGAADSVMPLGFGLSILNLVLIALAAYLGGKLVYEQAVAVDAAAVPDEHGGLRG
ncbi:DUF2231 domain-containing protein [Ramlibacter sp.]|uniref:DUF2231 domain-containing protein n=1 Tax=Ramlibacter sp. TaxID=1917967 RepID=UPI003D0D3ECC